jgi:hypothetical protein
VPAVATPVGETAVAVDIRLSIGGRLVGRVVERAGGAPIPLARVTVETGQDGTGLFPFGASTVTDEQGRFELGGLAAGRRNVVAAAFAHHGRILALDVLDGERIGPLDIDLAKTAPGEDPQLELVGIGVQLTPRGDALVVEAVVAGGGAAEVGLRPGDEIVSVDGVPVAGIGMEEAVARIRGPEGTVVRIAFRRDGAKLEVLVPRRRLQA